MLVRVCLTVTSLLLAGAAALAQDAQPLNLPHPGGLPAWPIITSIERAPDGVVVTWDGPAGYYQLYRRDSPLDAWQPVGDLTLSRRATVAGTDTNAFFRVLGPAPHFAGARSCRECHASIQEQAGQTRHARAFEALKAQGLDTDADRLRFYTVGRDPDPSKGALPTGFLDEAATPHLAGVQCENCHGPAARHAASETDPVVRPRVEIAAALCGGCHSAEALPAYPQYTQWLTSGHARVTAENLNPDRCGRCHHGDSRLALLHGDPVPSGGAHLGVVCVVCHDPHRVTPHPHQLRNPLQSTKDFFLTTSDDFAQKYDPEINVCAQCHNHRGASWSGSTRPPHHSPQYNMLLGTVGELPAGVATRLGPHAGIEGQCVACHMRPPADEPDAAQAGVVTGHDFRFKSYAVCRACHANPEALGAFARQVISNRLARVKTLLDTWGASAAPAPLRAKYGPLSWEYSPAGDLSPGGPSPTSAEQALIPDLIKKARFNLYLVQYDGSHGLHNPPFAATLLQAAEDWVQQALAEGETAAPTSAEPGAAPRTSGPAAAAAFNPITR